MNCLTKLSQKKRVTKSYIRAFLATMISKRDSSDIFLRNVEIIVLVGVK